MRAASRRWIDGLAAMLLAAGVLGVVGCASVSPEERTQLLDQARAQRDLGSDHLANGRTPLAIRALQHAAELDPSDGMTQLYLGEALRRRGHLDAARVAAESAVELSPKSHAAKISLSALMIQMEDYEKAIELLDVVIGDPTYSAPWQARTNRGWAQLKRGHTTPARKDFEAALDYYPGYWPATLNLGILAKAEGRMLEAASHLSVVAETSPSDGAQAEANFRLAEILVSLGQRQRAVEHLKIAFELSPHGPWGRQSRKYLSLLRGG